VSRVAVAGVNNLDLAGPAISLFRLLLPLLLLAFIHDG